MSDAQLVMEVSCAECLQTIRHDFFGWVARGCGNCAQGVPGWGGFLMRVEGSGGNRQGCQWSRWLSSG